MINNNFSQHYFLLKKAERSGNVNNINPQFDRPDVIYKFRFVSLIPPFLINDLRLSTLPSHTYSNSNKNLLLKQSYLLFTWFHYLKNSRLSKSNRARSVIKFSFLPTTRSVYTLIKAPMAHKTNSKEQYVFQTFHFKTSIKTYFNVKIKPSSINQALYVLFMTRQMFPFFETNLLLLKNFSIIISFNDRRFFNYFKF